MKHLSRPLGRNLLVRLMLLSCLVALLGLALGGDGQIAHATPKQARQAQSLANPVGTWNLQVFFLDCSRKGQTEPSQIEMDLSGAWVNYTPYPGGGTWYATGTSTFNYLFTEIIIVNGQFMGFVQVTQQAQLTSSTTYTASGSGSSYDSQGHFLETCDTQTTATLA